MDTKSAFCLYQVSTSVRLSACISTAPTEGISFKLGIGDTYENMSRKYEFGLNGTKVLGNSLEDASTVIAPGGIKSPPNAMVSGCQGS
jgi:hypothetical protein